jgi:hypothetical protein
MQVERYPLCLHRGESGERVSNAWVICLRAGDNVPKGTLIPNTSSTSMEVLEKGGDRKAYRPEMNLRPIS